MLADRAAFIHAILADPDNDVPRLVFADWLDETGDLARAEFIRVQCWLARHTEVHPDWQRQKERETKLLEANASVWWIPNEGSFNSEKVYYGRGFLSYIDALTVSEFIHIAPDFISRTPTQRLRLGFVHPSDLTVLSACPCIQYITELWLCVEHRFCGNVEEIFEFMQSPYVNNLIRLDCGSCLSGRSIAGYLAQSKALPNLKHLALDYFLSGEEESSTLDLLALLQAPHRANLVGLRLSCFGTTEQLSVFCGCPTVTRLSHFEFSGYPLSDAGALVLIHCPFFSKLQYLIIDMEEHTLTPNVITQLRDHFGSRLHFYQDLHANRTTKGRHRLALKIGHLPLM